MKNKYLKVIEPEYVFYKIIPHTSTRNFNAYKISMVINSCYENFLERIHKEKTQWTYRKPHKVSYFIVCDKYGANFYFIIPKYRASLFKDKISDTWKKVTIQEVKELPSFSDRAVRYQMQYTKEDALSLNVNRVNNDLLSSTLNVIDILGDDDKVGIFYNFIPTGEYYQRGFRNTAAETLNKFKQSKPLEKNKASGKYIGLSLLRIFISLADSLQEALAASLGGSKPADSILEGFQNLISQKSLSSATEEKAVSEVIKTQILILSDSPNVDNAETNALSITSAYRAIKEDNSLSAKKVIGIKRRFTDYNLKIECNNMSHKEIGANLISSPGKELVDKYKLEAVKVTETPVPNELLGGYLPLGFNTYKGHRIPVYLSSQKNVANLGVTLLGPQGAGKTTYMAMYAKAAIERGESVIVPDFIKNCELAHEVAKVTPPDKLIRLNLMEEGLGFNEVQFKEGMSTLEIMTIASTQSQLLMALLNSVNDCGEPLSNKMRRFLSSAAKVCFIHSNRSFKEVSQILEDYNTRHKYIEMIPSELRPFLDSSVSALEELDEFPKDSKPSTKSSKIEGILDRMNLLREDIRLDYMFNKPLTNNINFAEAMNQGKVILIEMPENDYPVKQTKNILVTYFISRIWIASQVRGGLGITPTRCHCLIDELFQAPTAEGVLSDILVEARKFQLKFVLSCHYLSQLRIQQSVKGSGGSYVLFKGADKKNFKELKEELDPFEVEDLQNLDPFHCMSFIRCGLRKDVALITDLYDPAYDNQEKEPNE